MNPPSSSSSYYRQRSLFVHFVSPFLVFSFRSSRSVKKWMQGAYRRDHSFNVQMHFDLRRLFNVWRLLNVRTTFNIRILFNVRNLFRGPERNQKKAENVFGWILYTQPVSLGFKNFLLYIFNAHAKSLAQYDMLAFSRLILTYFWTYFHARLLYTRFTPLLPWRDLFIIPQIARFLFYFGRFLITIHIFSTFFIARGNLMGREYSVLAFSARVQIPRHVGFSFRNTNCMYGLFLLYNPLFSLSLSLWSLFVFKVFFYLVRL